MAAPGESIAVMGRREDWAETVWKSDRVGHALVLVFTGIAVWAAYTVRSPGVSVGLLATAAGIMSIRTDMHIVEKVSWMLILMVLATAEIHSIGKSNFENNKQRAELNSEFSHIASTQKSEFEATAGELTRAYELSQKQFKATIDDLSQTNHQERRRFRALVTQNKKLFEHEEQLAESYSGRITAGKMVTPHNGCEGKAPPGSTLILYPDYTGFADHFPYTVLEVNGRPQFQLKQVSPGVITPILDIRDADDKIIARFDENGFVVGRRLSVSRPNPSTLIVIDEYGNEAINISYFNDHAISLSRYIYVNKQKRPLGQFASHASFGSGSCIGGSIGSDFLVR
ncbi:hypothetical protein [Acidisarcina polymorpha]|uniref:hypothetical protein n=1 Tax=Acidisarcina polymorpha TaxID=2211140 RepID=UPI000DEF5071|nr:hypothetical protein [Acidisarcina polymorpha]